MNDNRVRWRMTLEELCYQLSVTPHELERWALLGAFGPRWRENRDRGKWRHISKEVVHRAILMERLIAVGMTEERAAPVVKRHQLSDKDQPLETSMKGVTVTIHRNELNLP